MNKSYGRMGFDRPRINTYTRKISPPIYGMRKGNSLYKKILRQIVLCIILVLFVILIKNINTPITNRVTEMMKTTLNQQMDVKKSMKKIVRYAQEIPDFPNKMISVFHGFGKEEIEGFSFVAPIQGEIISPYGENIDPVLNTKSFQLGVNILPAKSQPIVSIADGEIIEIGESEKFGKFIKIQHKTNVSSFYGNCSEVIGTKGQKVKQGQEIGRWNHQQGKDVYLHFELWVDDHVVDPTHYIRFDKKNL